MFSKNHDWLIAYPLCHFYRSEKTTLTLYYRIDRFLIDIFSFFTYLHYTFHDFFRVTYLNQPSPEPSPESSFESSPESSPESSLKSSPESSFESSPK